MLTVIFLFGGMILVVALIFVVMKSGMRGGRKDQSGEAEVTKQNHESGGRPVV